MRAVLLALAVSTGGLVASCASIEPQPCTAEWVDWQRDRILTGFARSHAGQIASLRDLAATLDRKADGEGYAVTALIRLVAETPKVLALAEDFAETAIPDFERTLSRCGSKERSLRLFTDMLRREGVDAKAVEWIETLGQLAELDRPV